jgi:formamidopyrimidine-DNA glycosylase
VPELPEVEVLVRHLRPLLQNRRIRKVNVRRAKVLGTTPVRRLERKLGGARFVGVSRKGKFILFHLRSPQSRKPFTLLGHLGMTGRMYILPAKQAPPKHTAVMLELGRENFIFEDTRYFGRFTLDASALPKLGPEPLEGGFTVETLALSLGRSRQAVKTRLLDQSLVAGVGNIYASEALFRAGICPKSPARRLNRRQVERLWQAIRDVLSEAIECGSTVPLNYAGTGEGDGLFYFGRAPETPNYYDERLVVYDRANRPCPKCGTMIKRIVQASRSTFYCPLCQRPK